ncbi:MAG TPA: hypothetical protein VGB03_07555, partial [Acidimicrobiales bacterium]
AGEIVHAVDEQAGRLYLALAFSGSGVTTPATILSPDAQRQLMRIVMIDEAAFDRGDAAFAATFGLPTSQLRLQAHFLLSLKVVRHGRPDRPPRLLAVMASPTVPPTLPTGTPLPAPYDHQLVQWDPSRWASGAAVGAQAGHENKRTPDPLLDGPGTWAHHLTACATAPMASGGNGNYQWGTLVKDDAVYLGCQSSPGAGAVVRVALVDAAGKANGESAAGVHSGAEQVFALSQQISDVLVDEGGGRLLLRGWLATGSTGGTTWWVFDAHRRRYAGSIAALQSPGFFMGTGIDSSTGRLYSLIPDHITQGSGGVTLPIRGGFQFSDTRLDPVPPLENVRPDLAYNGTFAVKVDRATRRVFVRRGLAASAVTNTYPSTKTDTPAITEPYYRVLQDRVPIPAQPPEIDDSGFTTDVDEQEGLTTASFLGTGAGYGARTVLTGGTRAVTNGQDLRSPCSRDDREVLVGSVGAVSVSDQSTSAEAAAMDADARTREILGEPVNRCRPTPSGNFEGCTASAADTGELAFDEPLAPRDGKVVDDNKDGCPDRTGVNRYAAQCLGEGTKESGRVPRDGFKARARCAQRQEEASAESTGATSSNDLLARATGNSTPAPLEVRVGYSHSDVSVERELGRGIEVEVNSIARNVELVGVGSIGVIRAVATSEATGRTRRAEGKFERTVCGVDLPTLKVADCIGKGEEQRFVDALNQALGSRGRARLRDEDPALAEGSASGYRAAVQRDRDDLFADRVINRDASLAVPALELTLFLGDGGSVGAGRQILHFAGAQAATSYGIACLYGQVGDRCATADEAPGLSPGEPPGPEGAGFDGTGAVTTGGDDTTALAGGPAAASGPRESRLVRLLKAPFRAAAEALRLLFNNPRELGLVASVWALLYAPCWLGERRRSLAALRARRAALGAV